VLGATARGIDLARPLSEPSLGQILLALGRYGVLRFPDQHLDLGELKLFSEQFGKIQAPPPAVAIRPRNMPRSTSSRTSRRTAAISAARMLARIGTPT
jgi:alpha-ketoglutarate-dependent taurine dioxygenase